MAVSELKFVPASEFKQRTGAAVADPHLRRSFRTAMDYLMAKRAAQFPDSAALERQRALIFLRFNLRGLFFTTSSCCSNFIHHCIQMLGTSFS